MHKKMAHSAMMMNNTGKTNFDDLVLGVAQIAKEEMMKSKPSSESYTFYEQIMSGNISPA